MRSTLRLLRTTALLLCAPAWIAAQQPPPTMTAITPSAAYPGTVLTVTLTGSNFLPDDVVEPNNFYICGSNVVVVRATQITATYTIRADGERMSTVCVTSGGVKACGPFFTITPSDPAVMYLFFPASGNRGNRGDSVRVTIYGGRYTPEMTVAISNPGVSIDYAEVESSGFVYLELTIGLNAAPGPANLTATTVAGTSPPLVFTVNTPPPTLASVTPAVGAQGTSVPGTLTGTNFFARATVATSNAGIAAGSVVVVSETQISATFTIAPNAA